MQDDAGGAASHQYRVRRLLVESIACVLLRAGRSRLVRMMLRTWEPDAHERDFSSDSGRGRAQVAYIGRAPPPPLRRALSQRTLAPLFHRGSIPAAHA